MRSSKKRIVINARRLRLSLSSHARASGVITHYCKCGLPRPCVKHSKYARHVVGYNTSRWRKLRLQFLRANPLCVRCLEIGKTSAATVADHVVPISGPDDPRMFNAEELQALCQTCDKAKTLSDRREGMTLDKR